MDKAGNEERSGDSGLDDRDYGLTLEEAEELSIRAGAAFKPNAPIDTRELFAGRWDQLTRIADAVTQAGLNVVIFGERGVGKTSLANVIRPVLSVFDNDPPTVFTRLIVRTNVTVSDNFSTVWCKLFDQVTIVDSKPTIGFRISAEHQRLTLRQAYRMGEEVSIDDVRIVLASLDGSVFILDEFDRMDPLSRPWFTDLIKTISDQVINSTIVLVGVSDTVDELVKDHASIVRAVIQVQLPRMNEQELDAIISTACNVLDIEVDASARTLIIATSQGLPHYTHLIGLHAVRVAAGRHTRLVTAEHVNEAFQRAAKDSFQSIRDTYLSATRSARRDSLYESVALACASATSKADALGYFHPSDVIEPMELILGRGQIQIAVFQRHLNEFCETQRGAILQRVGEARARKYRFKDPLMPPFIFMHSTTTEVVAAAVLDKLRRMRRYQDLR